MKLTVTLTTPTGDVVLASPEIPDTEDARIQTVVQYFEVIGPRLLALLEIQRAEPQHDHTADEDLPDLPAPVPAADVVDPELADYLSANPR